MHNDKDALRAPAPVDWMGAAEEIASWDRDGIRTCAVCGKDFDGTDCSHSIAECYAAILSQHAPAYSAPDLDSADTVERVARAMFERDHENEGVFVWEDQPASVRIRWCGLASAGLSALTPAPAGSEKGGVMAKKKWHVETRQVVYRTYEVEADDVKTAEALSVEIEPFKEEADFEETMSIKEARP